MQNNEELLNQEHKVESEGYRILKYLRAITTLSIFNLIFTIMWIIGVVQWVVVHNKDNDSPFFILFIVSFVFFILTWLAASVIAIVSVIRHFKKNLDIYPKWIYILSNVMIALPDLVSFVLYIWISRNSISTYNK